MENQKIILENQKTLLENQETALKKQATLETLKEQLRKVEGRPQSVVNQVSESTRQAAVIIEKPSTFKIPTFDGTGPWELYHKQFEAAAAYNQWTDMEKAIALTVHLTGAAQQVLATLPQSHTLSTSHWVTVWSRNLDKNCPSEEAGTQEPHIEVWGRITRLCSRHLTPNPRGIPKHVPRICGLTRKEKKIWRSQNHLPAKEETVKYQLTVPPRGKWVQRRNMPKKLGFRSWNVTVQTCTSKHKVTSRRRGSMSV